MTDISGKAKSIDILDRSCKRLVPFCEILLFDFYKRTLNKTGDPCPHNRNQPNSPPCKKCRRDRWHEEIKSVHVFGEKITLYDKHKSPQKLAHSQFETLRSFIPPASATTLLQSWDRADATIIFNFLAHYKPASVHAEAGEIRELRNHITHDKMFVTDATQVQQALPALFRAVASHPRVDSVMRNWLLEYAAHKLQLATCINSTPYTRPQRITTLQAPLIRRMLGRMATSVRDLHFKMGGDEPVWEVTAVRESKSQDDDDKGGSEMSGSGYVGDVMMTLVECRDLFLHLKGEAGSGKSVCMREASLKMLEKLEQIDNDTLMSRLSDGDLFLPVFIDLSSLTISTVQLSILDGPSLRDIIIESLSRVYDPDDTRVFITAGLQRGILRFMLDAFDELPILMDASPADIARVSRAFQALVRPDELEASPSHLIVSSREFHAPSNTESWPVLSICHMSLETQHAAIEKILSHCAGDMLEDERDELVHAILQSDRLESMREQPFLVSLICQCVVERRDKILSGDQVNNAPPSLVQFLPESVSDVLDAYVDRQLMSASDKLNDIVGMSPEVIRWFASTVACVMLRGSSSLASTSAKVDPETPNTNTPERLTWNTHKLEEAVLHSALFTCDPRAKYLRDHVHSLLRGLSDCRLMVRMKLSGDTDVADDDFVGPSEPASSPATCIAPPESIRFVHRRLCEYLVAVRICDLYAQNHHKSDIAETLSGADVIPLESLLMEPGWHEVAVLLLQMGNTARQSELERLRCTMYNTASKLCRYLVDEMPRDTNEPFDAQALFELSRSDRMERWKESVVWGGSLEGDEENMQLEECERAAERSRHWWGSGQRDYILLKDHDPDSADESLEMAYLSSTTTTLAQPLVCGTEDHSKTVLTLESSNGSVEKLTRHVEPNPVTEAGSSSTATSTSNMQELDVQIDGCHEISERLQWEWRCRCVRLLSTFARGFAGNIPPNAADLSEELLCIAILMITPWDVPSFRQVLAAAGAFSTPASFLLLESSLASVHAIIRTDSFSQIISLRLMATEKFCVVVQEHIGDLWLRWYAENTRRRHQRPPIVLRALRRFRGVAKSPECTISTAELEIGQIRAGLALSSVRPTEIGIASGANFDVSSEENREPIRAQKAYATLLTWCVGFIERGRVVLRRLQLTYLLLFFIFALHFTVNVLFHRYHTLANGVVVSLSKTMISVQAEAFCFVVFAMAWLSSYLRIRCVRQNERDHRKKSTCFTWFFSFIACVAVFGFALFSLYVSATNDTSVSQRVVFLHAPLSTTVVSRENSSSSVTCDFRVGCPFLGISGELPPQIASSNMRYQNMSTADTNTSTPVELTNTCTWYCCTNDVIWNVRSRLLTLPAGDELECTFEDMTPFSSKPDMFFFPACIAMLAASLSVAISALPQAFYGVICRTRLESPYYRKPCLLRACLAVFPMIPLLDALSRRRGASHFTMSPKEPESTVSRPITSSFWVFSFLVVLGVAIFLLVTGRGHRPGGEVAAIVIVCIVFSCCLPRGVLLAIVQRPLKPPSLIDDSCLGHHYGEALQLLLHPQKRVWLLVYIVSFGLMYVGTVGVLVLRHWPTNHAFRFASGLWMVSLLVMGMVWTDPNPEFLQNSVGNWRIFLLRFPTRRYRGSEFVRCPMETLSRLLSSPRLYEVRDSLALFLADLKKNEFSISVEDMASVRKFRQSFRQRCTEIETLLGELEMEITKQCASISD